MSAEKLQSLVDLARQDGVPYDRADQRRQAVGDLVLSKFPDATLAEPGNLLFSHLYHTPSYGIYIHYRFDIWTLSSFVKDAENRLRSQMVTKAEATKVIDLSPLGFIYATPTVLTTEIGEQEMISGNRISPSFAAFYFEDF